MTTPWPLAFSDQAISSAISGTALVVVSLIGLVTTRISQAHAKESKRQATRATIATAAYEERGRRLDDALARLVVIEGREIRCQQQLEQIRQADSRRRTDVATLIQQQAEMQKEIDALRKGRP